MLKNQDPILKDKNSNLEIKTELTPEKKYLTKMFVKRKKTTLVAKKEGDTYLDSVNKCYRAIRRQWEKRQNKKRRKHLKKQKAWDELSSVS